MTGSIGPPRLGVMMASEIDEQPDVLARQLAQGLPSVRAVAEKIRAFGPRFVVLAARGTSDHAALYAKYLVETALGLPAGLASPSTVTVYDSRPRLASVLWLAVSQSGASPDLLEATAAARRNGALTVAVTNTPDAPLAEVAEHHLDVLAGPERAVAATKSYTAELLALWLLVDAWRGGNAANARALPDAAAAVLSSSEILEVADRFRGAERAVTTGRGYSYPTAKEFALKLMETSYLSAHAFSGADLLHGPLAMVDRECPVLALAPRGRGGLAMRPVLERLANQGVDVCLVGDPVAPAACQVVPLLRSVGEELDPVLQILPLQRLAHAVAVERDLDPDAPRFLSKATETW